MEPSKIENSFGPKGVPGQKPSKSQKLPEMAEPKRLKHPFWRKDKLVGWRWTCNWVYQKKKCKRGKGGKPLTIEGFSGPIVRQAAEGHWNQTHLKEAQA